MLQQWRRVFYSTLQRPIKFINIKPQLDAKKDPVQFEDLSKIIPKERISKEIITEPSLQLTNWKQIWEEKVLPSLQQLSKQSLTIDNLNQSEWISSLVTLKNDLNSILSTNSFPPALLWRGYIHYVRGDVTLALEDLENCIRLLPKENLSKEETDTLLRAKYYLSFVLAKKAQIQNAILLSQEVLQELENSQIEDATTLLFHCKQHLCFLFWKEERYEECISIATSILEKEIIPLVLYYMGDSLFCLEQYEKSIKPLKQFISLQTNDSNFYINALVKLTCALFYSENFDSCIQFAKQSQQFIEEKIPQAEQAQLKIFINQISEVLNMLSASLLQQGNRLEAKYYILQSCKYRPQLAECYIVRGNLLYELGEYKEAVKQFTFALAKDKINPMITLFRARALEKLGQMEEAMADFYFAENAIASNTDSTTATHTLFQKENIVEIKLGLALTLLQTIERDTHELQIAKEQNQSTKIIELNNAITSKRRKALKCLNDVIELEPTNLIALQNRAQFMSSHVKMFSEMLKQQPEEDMELKRVFENYYNQSVSDYTSIFEITSEAMRRQQEKENDSFTEQLQKQKVLAIFNRGMLHFIMENYSNAIADWQKINKNDCIAMGKQFKQQLQLYLSNAYLKNGNFLSFFKNRITSSFD